MSAMRDAPMPTRDTPAEILKLEARGPDLFVGESGGNNHLGSVFGGRLVAQSLLAAMETVEALPVSSLHAYFLAPGVTSLPLEYRVVRLRDSRRFANRQITALQGGRPIFALLCEFHAPEEGFFHQAAAMPDVPPPEDVPTIQQFVRERAAELDVAAIRNFTDALPINMRPVSPETYLIHRPDRPERIFWFRQPSAPDIEDPRQHQCLLAFGSDYWLAGVAAVPHFFPTNSDHFMISSLDHSMWFHRPARADEWLLHHTFSPAAGDGLGLAMGRIFDRQGRLVASTAQESLLRRLAKPSDS